MPPKWVTDGSFAVVDLETTGIDLETDRIVQVSVVMVDKTEVSGMYTAYVNPERDIPDSASEVHGVYDRHVKDAPVWDDVEPEVVKRIGDRMLMGYNALHFDLPMLRTQSKNSVFDEDLLDVMIWVRKVDRFVKGKGRHKLGKTCERWGVSFEYAHDATADCLATWRLFKAMVRKRTFPETLRQTLDDQEKMARIQEEEHQAYKKKMAAKEAV